MRPIATPLLTALLLTLCAARLDAQAAFTTGPAYGVSAYAGYMQFANLFRATNGASFSNGNAAQIGVQGGASVNRIIAFLGNLTYAKAPAHFQLDSIAGAVPFRASPDLGVWLLDANVQFRVPLGYTITPFVQVGVGAAHYTVRMNDERHGDTGLAYTVGIGADVPLFRNIGLLLLARDHIVALEWDDVGDPRIDDHLTKSTTTNIGVSLGLEIGY